MAYNSSRRIGRLNPQGSGYDYGVARWYEILCAIRLTYHRSTTRERKGKASVARTKVQMDTLLFLLIWDGKVTPGTSEQFHSQLKTDLDLERLPVGKFATNDLVLHAGIFAYNILRLIGQESLREKDAPIRNDVQRRRIRTVIQNLIYMAARLVRHARNICLNFGSNGPWFTVAQRVYKAFA